jgi:hypothetical protein
METVKTSVERGTPLPRAIRGALLLNDLEVGEFADKWGFPRQTTSQAINGTMRASDALIVGLVKELGGTPAEWRELLWLAGKPDHVDEPKPARTRKVAAAGGR